MAKGCAFDKTLASYLRKLSRDAYKITDDDMAALETSGWSQAAIVELTLVGSLAAALIRLDCGMAALEAESP